MGRKKPEPRHLGKEQRQQVEWNMLDRVCGTGHSSQQTDPQGDLIIIQDNDPTLALEWEAAQTDEGRKAKVVLNGTSGSVSQFGAEKSAQLPAQEIFQSECGVVMPENVRQFFRRLEVCLQLIEMKDRFLCLPLYSVKHSRSKEVMDDWHWVVGKFRLQLQDHDDLPLTPDVAECLSDLEQCWLYVACDNDSEPVVCFEMYDEEMNRERQVKVEEEANSRKVTTRRLSGSKRKQAMEDKLGLYWVVSLEFSDTWKFFQKLSRSGQKKFQLVYGKVDSNEKQLEVTVYGRKNSLQSLDHPSQGFTIREVNNFMFEAMNHFYNLGPMYGRGDPNLRQDFQELYDGVRALQAIHTVSVTTDVQHPSLKPRLRPYQQDAVRWMLQRERFGEDAECAHEEDDVHPLYTEVTTHCGKTLFYNRQGGSLIEEKPRKKSSPPGGILADEMGLGKTVEVLCCLLLHPRPAVPPPPRLPTLMEMECQSEESCMESSAISSSSSSSDFQSLGTFAIKNSEDEKRPLKRVESDSGSFSSVPSEVVSFVVTDDHSYQAIPHGEDGNCDRNDPESLTLQSSSSHCVPDAATVSEGDFKPPLKLTLKRVSADGGETLHDQSSTGSVPQPQTKKQRTTSRKKNLKTTGKKKRKSNNMKQNIQTEKDHKKEKLSTQEENCNKNRTLTKAQKRKLLKSVEDENVSEVQNDCAKTKHVRSGKYFYYVTEENVRETLFDNVIKRPRQQLFECVCGEGEEEAEFANGCAPSRKRKRKHQVKCVECGTSQHAHCVNYDLEDPFRGPYKCPHCHYNGKPLSSGATLIISPYSIAHQWLDEIQKHIQEKSLRVFEYTGVRYQGYIQPQTLASQDIVITTYETLRNELNYVDLKPTNSVQGRVLRKPKKFMAQPTPLTAVEWWRICLDEAQMVESVTTKTAEMALRLSCVNRWCVTGTPLNQSIKDLYGLLAFIGIDPYCVEEWWTRYLYEPYLQGIKQPLLETLAKVMWRTSMKDVKSQLNLPDKTEVIKHLTFSPVEDVFYRRLYQKCSHAIMGSTFYLSEEKKSTKLRKLDHQTVNKYLIPLRKLRQACCHPQAVSGSSLSMRNSVLTMEELLQNLIKKTMLECVESHRCMIAAMNGQAGIYLIEDDPRVSEAVEMYRAVLRSVEELEHQKQLKTDALPHIHALHNLAQVLATKPPGVGQTTRDHLLVTQCEELKKQYLQRASSLVSTCKEQLVRLHQSAHHITQQLGPGLHWYQLVMKHAVQSGNEDQLVHKVRGSLAGLSTGLTKSFHNMSGLQYIIVLDLTELQDLREKQMKLMKDLESYDLKEEVILCCLRPVDAQAPKRTCFFCKLEVDFLNWESRLFCMTISQRTQGGVDNTLYRDGSWKDSPLETMLKALHSYAKTHLLDGQILRDAAMVFSLFEVWKKEFKQMRSLWTKLKEEVSAADEVQMAVTRMRLRLPGEEEQETRDMNICEKVELPAMLKKFATDQKVYTNQFKVRCGQLDYLRNLAKGNSGEFQDGINPEECPICKNPLGRNWSVLHCGHCCCITCIQHLLEHSPAARVRDVAVKCMICRERTRASDISYISTSRSSASHSSVKGSHSTKVGAIVQCLLDIQRKDPEAKALVFATWVEVLKVIGCALDDNFINYTQLYDHGSNFEKNVTKFRTDRMVRVLLLPYSTGSKGLNLFEANHVLLVEPTYSPSEEAQAIGRVYRMGQTRPTHIYRFLVRHTIEERIHSLMESTLRPAADANQTDQDSITLGQLISLFNDTDSQHDHSEDTDGETVQEDGRCVGVEASAGPSRSANEDFDGLSSSVAGPSRAPGVSGSNLAGLSSLCRVVGPGSVSGPAGHDGGLKGTEPSTAGLIDTGSSTAGLNGTGPGTAGLNSTGPGTAGLKGTGPSTAGLNRTGPGTAGLNRTGPGTAGLNGTGPGTAGLNSTGPSTAGLNRTGPGTAGLNGTGPSTAGLNGTGPSTAGLNRTGPSTAGLNSTRPSTAGLNSTGPSTAGLNSTGPSTAGLNSTRPSTAGLNGTRPSTAGPSCTPGMACSGVTQCGEVGTEEGTECQSGVPESQCGHEAGRDVVCALVSGPAGNSTASSATHPTCVSAATAGAGSVSACRGPEGVPGVTGPEGVPGVTGSEGVPGVTGSEDIPGVTGSEDIPGVTGSEDIPGVTWSEGVPGVTGPEDIPGVTWSEGVPGVTGPEDVPAVIGSEGVPAVIGSEGVPAVTGPEGVPAVTGPEEVHDPCLGN
ncbi:E3 ubiquitin-protein ligase SHPRH-like [Babylonia areolata]|uniref:E3 ubiquitin-protein ligase SHPRH-like n=1 Tax=Babylonia areolata TaxID=304850 RepID=UPI003FD08B84